MDSTNMLEQFKAFSEMQRAMGGGSWFDSQNAFLIVTAITSLIAAGTSWLAKQTSQEVKLVNTEQTKTLQEQTKTLGEVHKEVNSKTAAMVIKLDSQEVAILALTKELATLRERDQVAKIATAVTAATSAV